jgi:hypothetical protein
MGILSALFGGGSSGAVYSKIVVDGAGMAGSSRSESASPKNQLILLRRIGNYAKQEKVPARVVFHTEPLRKVADKQEFEGAVACFAGNEEAYQKRLLSEVSGGALLITSDAAMELAAEGRGIPVMRVSTFSKVLDGNSSKGRSDRGRSDRGRSERGEQKSGQDRNRNRNRNRSRSGSGEGPKRSSEPESTGGVESLIDIVE